MKNFSDEKYAGWIYRLDIIEKRLVDLWTLQQKQSKVKEKKAEKICTKHKNIPVGQGIYLNRLH